MDLKFTSQYFNIISVLGAREVFPNEQSIHLFICYIQYILYLYFKYLYFINYTVFTVSSDYSCNPTPNTHTV